MCRSSAPHESGRSRSRNSSARSGRRLCPGVVNGMISGGQKGRGRVSQWCLALVHGARFWTPEPRRALVTAQALTGIQLGLTVPVESSGVRRRSAGPPARAAAQEAAAGLDRGAARAQDERHGDDDRGAGDAICRVIVSPSSSQASATATIGFTYA